MPSRFHALGLSAIAAILLAAAAANAQQGPAARVRGVIESVDGSTLHVKSREGAMVTVKLADNVGVSAVVKASLADIKPNSYVGIAAIPQGSGPQKALEVLIFPEAMRGANEGHSAWDLMPESTMTNATVVDDVTKVEGRTLTLKYKDGQQTIVVPPDAPIVTFAPGTRDELKPGAAIVILRGVRKPDGSVETGRISVGRGIVPPM
jgi:hypothetical protein